MKNLVKIILLMFVFISFQSCSDILKEPSPSVSVTQDVALGTPEGVKSVRAYMFALLHTFEYTTLYMLAPGALADNLYVRPSISRFAGKAHNTPGSTTNNWETSYAIIQQANLLIDAVDEGVVPPKLLTQYRGEAFFMRAFAEHYLARTYGYEPGQIPNFGQGEGFNLSIVIRTDPVLNAEDATFKARSTIVETYKQIESDLLNAIDLLSKSSASGPNYPTQAAAEALLARVYLYWGKYELADKYASYALNHTDAHLASPNEVGTLFDVGTNIEDIFRTVITNAPTESQGIDNALASYTSVEYLAMVPTQDVMDLFSSNDARLAWFSPCFDEADGVPAPGCLGTNPAIAGGTEAVELDKWNADLGSFGDNVPLLRVSEQVLIQAEARLHTQGTAAAIARLNDLRHSRGLGDYSGGNSPDEVLHAILTARRREFIGEGMRFFDLKRLGMDIRKAPGTIDKITQTVLYENRKVLAKLPVDEVALSHQAAKAGIISPDSVLVQNPGYRK